MILGRFFILMVAVISSVTPVFSKELEKFGWDALQTSAIRSLVAAIILGMIFNKKILEARKDVLGVLYSSLSLLLAQTCYIYAAQHAGMGLVISIMYLGPVWTVVYERLVLKSRNKQDIIACAFGFIGTLLIAFGFNWDSEGEMRAVAVAFIASIGFALFIITSKGSTKKVPPEAVAFWSCAFISIVLGWTLFSAPWTIPALRTSLIFGTTNGAIYFLLYFTAIKMIPSASETSVWCYIEVAIVWAIGIMAYHEVMLPVSLVGTVSIVTAGLILAFRSKT